MFKIELNTENSYKALGLFLRVHRIRTGYSLRDLGSITNISHTLIANIEKGKVSGSDKTLSDLFTSLNVPYFDTKDIEEEFKETYDKVFNFLYKYNYTRATIEMNKLLAKEHIYRHSVLITDYALIKFLYLVLLGHEAKDQYIGIDVLKRVEGNFSAKQKQLFYLIEGVDFYNQGLYSEAEERLSKSLEQGVSNLDYLTRVYLVKCYVKMYRLMDVISTGNQTIEFFENKIIYLRAMEVRLSIAYAYMLVRNFDRSAILLESVSEFSNNFNAKYLIEESNILLAALCIYKGEIDKASELLDKVTIANSVVYFLKIRVAVRSEKYEDVARIYDAYMDDNSFIKTKQQFIVMSITIRECGRFNMTDEEFIDNVNELIKIGVRGNDFEVVDSAYGYLVTYYKSKRMYKKALEASESAREYRRYGILKHN